MAGKIGERQPERYSTRKRNSQNLFVENDATDEEYLDFSSDGDSDYDPDGKEIDEGKSNIDEECEIGSDSNSCSQHDGDQSEIFEKDTENSVPNKPSHRKSTPTKKVLVESNKQRRPKDIDNSGKHEHTRDKPSSFSEPPKNSRPYPCNKKSCIKPISEKLSRKIPPFKIPPHSSKCLFKRILLNADETNNTMTVPQMVENLCKEFPYYTKLRELDEKHIFRCAYRTLCRNKQIFENHKHLGTWTVIKSSGDSPEASDDEDDKSDYDAEDTENDEEPTLEDRNSYPCKTRACYQHSTRDVLRKDSSLKIPPHTRVCLVRRVLTNANGSKPSLTLSQIIDNLCKEFPYFDEYRRSDREQLFLSFERSIKRNLQVFFNYDKNNRKYSLFSTKEKTVTPVNSESKEDQSSRETPVDTQRVYPCLKRLCFQPKVPDFLPKDCDIEIPTHSKTCLMKRVLSNGCEMTSKEIIENICKEFDFYAIVRRHSEQGMNKLFQNTLTMQKAIFKSNKQSKKWSLCESAKSIPIVQSSKEDKQKRLFPCNNGRCDISRAPEFLPKDSPIEIPQHSKICLLRRILSNSVDSSSAMTIGVILQDLCDEFPYYDEFGKYSRSDLYDYIRNGLVSKPSIFKKDPGASAFYLIASERNLEKATENQVPYPCNKPTCFERASSFSIKGSKLEKDKPLHSKSCLLKRVLLKHNRTMHANKIIDDICEEFLYYKELIQKYKRRVYGGFRYTLKNCNDFKLDVKTDKCSLASMEKDTEQATSTLEDDTEDNQEDMSDTDSDSEEEANGDNDNDDHNEGTSTEQNQWFPCNKKSCYKPRSRDVLPNNKSLKIPPHTRVCFIRKVLSNAVDYNYTMTLREIVESMCQEFPYFREFNEFDPDRLISSLSLALYRNLKIFFEVDKKTKKFSLTTSKTTLEPSRKSRTHDEEGGAEIIVEPQEVPTPVPTQRLFPCHKQVCYLPKVPEILPKGCTVEIPTHSKTCLMRRVLMNGNKMTSLEIIDDICKEFPFYAILRKQSESTVNLFFQNMLSHQIYFKRDKESGKWYLNKSSEVICNEGTSANRPLYPCNQLACYVPRNPNKLTDETKLSIPPHSRACLMLRVLLTADEDKHTMTLPEIVNSICEEFPYYKKLKEQGGLYYKAFYNTLLYNSDFKPLKGGMWTLSSIRRKNRKMVLKSKSLIDVKKNILSKYRPILKYDKNTRKWTVVPTSIETNEKGSKDLRNLKNKDEESMEICKIKCDNSEENQLKKPTVRSRSSQKRLRTLPKSKTVKRKFRKVLHTRRNIYKYDQNTGKWNVMPSTRTVESQKATRNTENKNVTDSQTSCPAQKSAKTKRVEAETTSEKQRLYPCHKPACYLPNLQEKKSKLEIPKHTRACLLERVLLKSVDPSLTSTEMIENVCDEFPFYMDLKKKDKKSLYQSFYNVLCLHRHIFAYEKTTKQYSLIQSVKGPSKNHQGSSQSSTFDNRALNASQAIEVIVLDDDVNLQGSESRITSDAQSSPEIQHLSKYAEMEEVAIKKECDSSQTSDCGKEMNMEVNDEVEDPSISPQSQQTQLTAIKTEDDVDVKPNIKASNTADDSLGFFGRYIKIIENILMSVPTNAATLEDIYEIVSRNDETKHITLENISEVLQIHEGKYFQKFELSGDFVLWTTLEDIKLNVLISRFMTVFEKALEVINIGSADEIYNYLNNHDQKVSLTTIERMLGIYGHEYLHCKTLGKITVYRKR